MVRKLHLFQALAALALLTSSASADPIWVNNLTTDAGFNTDFGGTTFESFGAEGRYGNNATNGTYEVGINRLNSQTPPNFQFGYAQGQRTWTSGQALDFELIYGGDITKTISWKIGGVQANIASGTPVSIFGGIQTIMFRTRSNAVGSTMELDNLVFTDLTTNTAFAAPTSIDASASGANTVNYAGLYNYDFTKSWKITGSMTMTWLPGSAPNNSSMSFQIKASQTKVPSAVVPEPGTIVMGLLALPSLLFVLRRRRNASA